MRTESDEKRPNVKLTIERLGVTIKVELSVSLDSYKGIFPPYEEHSEFLNRVFDQAVQVSSPEIYAQARQLLGAFEAALLSIHREAVLASREVVKSEGYD